MKIRTDDGMKPDELLMIGGSPRWNEKLKEFAKRCCYKIINVKSAEPEKDATKG